MHNETRWGSALKMQGIDKEVFRDYVDDRKRDFFREDGATADKSRHPS